MKSYVLYKSVPHEAGHENNHYLQSDGKFSLDPKDAKRYNVKTWLEFAITILQLAIKIFGTNLKYKRI
jgi:hypothetical protein